MFVTDSEIDNLISEDIPYIDLTTEILDIKEIPSKISFYAREEMRLSCIEEAKRVLQKCGAEVTFSLKSGNDVKKDDLILEAKGESNAILMAWKVTQNLIEYQSAVATKSRNFVNIAKEINPNIEVLTTRKSPPLTKKLTIKSVMVGGAYPHRLGLSETILIFREHIDFFGGYDKLIEHLKELKTKSVEKNIVIELKSSENISKFANFDIIQFDKLSSEETKSATKVLKDINPNIKILSAGGINMDNIRQYAGSGVDGIVLSSLYYVKPKDVKVVIEKM